MEHEHFTHPEAIRYLARKYNIEIRRNRINRREKQIQIFESMYLFRIRQRLFSSNAFKIRGRQGDWSFVFLKKEELKQ
jgi:DNA primase